jgi:hypothetical protein
MLRQPEPLLPPLSVFRPVVPRHWRPEPPDALPYPILSRLSRLRIAAPRLAARRLGKQPLPASDAGQLTGRFQGCAHEGSALKCLLNVLSPQNFMGDLSPPIPIDPQGLVALKFLSVHDEARRLAAVFQRSSSNVEGRNGYLSLRSHQLRGLDLPRKRQCFTAIHNFFLTRPDGTTAAERFFGHKPRSMFAAILESVELAPAPLSPPRKA